MAEYGDWSAWLDEHGGTMLLLARQWAPGRADAEDVVQEAFLRFWRSRDKADDPAAYLYVCVRNCAIELRRGKLRRDHRERAAARPEITPDWFAGAPQRQERNAQIELGLRRLPENQREVVIMKVWGRLTFQQIAVALAVPANTVASRFRYALEKLRAELAEERVP